MTPRLNVSSNPHVRTGHDTFHEMYNVILALLPATIFGIVHFGFHSLFIICASILGAMAAEYVFDMIAGRGNTLKDGSAIVTGLLLALVCPPTVPVYMPALGSVFAILFVKCFFGGLGQNFMNPALAGRAFLLISFGAQMTNYSVDGTSSATPLAMIEGGQSFSATKMFLGFADGHIGVSVAALLIGGIFLLIGGTITWQIPVATIVSFVLFMGIFGGHGFEWKYLCQQVCGGGLVLGAFFMATDPVTSPITNWGQLLFGILVGALSMIFRVYSNMADGTSYAIIIANLMVPLIDRVVIPAPFGLGRKVDRVVDDNGNGKFNIPKSATILAVITLIAGTALAGVYALTASRIAENQMAANLAAYEAVLPDATEFTYNDAITGSLEDLQESGLYKDGSFGRIIINEVVEGTDDAGNVTGHALSVTTMEGYDGEITLTVGILGDGTLTGIAFTEINETAGMGMLADTPDWRGQFDDNVESYTLLKNGGADEPHEIDSISGASTTSGAVVNAVNAALDFYHSEIAA